MDKATPRYVGHDFARMDAADGMLPHAVGVSNFQVTRANRSHPELSDGFGNTYNHAPMLTYWRGHFYIQYLSNPVDEHRGAGLSFLCRSANGVHWGKPEVAFPIIQAKAGVYHCEDGQEILIPEDTDAYMHQRVSFYHSSDDRLFATGFYGQTPSTRFCPWVNYGIGRAVREVYEDGSLGPLYFLKIMSNSGWREEALPFPLYTRSKDCRFIEICEEMQRDRLYVQQWAEEHGFGDEQIHIKTKRNLKKGSWANEPGEELSSFSWYHLNEDTIIGLWKQAVVGRSNDRGETWHIQREPSFATSGAKAFGQKTADGQYAIAFVNSLSSEHRYPLVVVTSVDGLAFDDMTAVFYEVPPRRYHGLHKDFGPQYIRGILESHKDYPHDAMWLCHSVNKEDIWVSRIPLPIRKDVVEHADDKFDENSPYVANWNLYSGLWAGVSTCKLPDGSTAIRLFDKDPCDYARAERIFPTSTHLKASLELMCKAEYAEPLHIELTDETGLVALRFQVGDGCLTARHASQTIKLAELSGHVEWLTLDIEANMSLNTCNISLNGQLLNHVPLIPIQKVNALSRMVLRTKPHRKAPGMDIEPEMPDLPGVDKPNQIERVYYIRRFNTTALHGS